MGDTIIEGLNCFIDKIREKENIDSKTHIVLWKQVSKPGFGNISTITWKAIYAGKPITNKTLFEVETKARVKYDDYERELSIKLVSEVIKFTHSDLFKSIVYGTNI